MFHPTENCCNPRWSTLNYTYTDAKIKSGAEEGLQLGLVPYSVAQLGVGYGSGDWQVNLGERGELSLITLAKVVQIFRLLSSI